MDDTAKEAKASDPRVGKEAWEAPTLVPHGTFSELTRFTAGPGADDGFFDPGLTDSQV
jgi:hypothetical protein